MTEAVIVVASALRSKFGLKLDRDGFVAVANCDGEILNGSPNFRNACSPAGRHPGGLSATFCLRHNLIQIVIR